MKNRNSSRSHFPKLIHNRQFIGLLFFIATVCIHTTTFACNGAIPGHYLNRFIDNKNGTITDKMTNLMWQKCTLGTTWNEQTGLCDAEINEFGYRIVDMFTWKEALARAQQDSFSSNNDWRLPNVKEIGSIYDPACLDSSSFLAIDIAIFDSSPSRYWTSTPSRKAIKLPTDSGNFVYVNSAYAMAFAHPSLGAKISSIDSKQAVRLVRSR